MRVKFCYSSFGSPVVADPEVTRNLRVSELNFPKICEFTVFPPLYRRSFSFPIRCLQ